MAAVGAVVAACTGTSTHRATQPPAPAVVAATTTATGPSGSPDNPFVTKFCRTEDPAKTPPKPGESTSGALDLNYLPEYAHLSADEAPQPQPDGVTFFKWGVRVRSPHPTVTLTIGAAARDYARLVTERLPSDRPGVVAITYDGTPAIDSEMTWDCWYVGGFNLLGGRSKACVPLDAAVAGEPVRHLMVSLDAGTCPEP